MNRNLETGKIVSIVFGPSKGKIGTIVDIIDQKRCLVDGPCGRQIINLKRIEPTKMKLEIGYELKHILILELLRFMKGKKSLLIKFH